jgi:hypothetical protein
MKSDPTHPHPEITNIFIPSSSNITKPIHILKTKQTIGLPLSDLKMISSPLAQTPTVTDSDLLKQFLETTQSPSTTSSPTSPPNPQKMYFLIL